MRMCILMLAAAAALGQTFEVASVRPTPPPQPGAMVFYGRPRGGPGSSDPGKITWASAALRSMVMTAYDVQGFQVTAPDWLAIERYDIIAKVAAGATRGAGHMMGAKPAEEG